MRAALLLTFSLLVTGLALLPSAEAKPLPEPHCIQVYYEIDLGPYTIVRSGCKSEIRQNGEPTNPCTWDPAPC